MQRPYKTCQTSRPDFPKDRSAWIKQLRAAPAQHRARFTLQDTHYPQSVKRVQERSGRNCPQTRMVESCSALNKV